jgi:hypothetical protein
LPRTISSLFGLFVIDEEKTFDNIDTWSPEDITRGSFGCAEHCRTSLLEEDIDFKTSFVDSCDVATLSVPVFSNSRPVFEKLLILLRFLGRRSKVINIIQESVK